MGRKHTDNRTPGAKPAAYATVANRYARAVVSRRTRACRWVKLACRRHLDDLERAGTKAFPYVFSAEAAHLACHFAESMPHWKGKLADPRKTQEEDRLLRLEPWQVFIRASVFGWVHRETGLRRFRIVYEEVPRKNGKTMGAAITGNYMLAADGEPGAEVYACAVSEDQAFKQTFRTAKEIAARAEGFAEHFGVEVNAASLTVPASGGLFEAVIGRPRDGASPHCSLIDEFHEHKTPDLYHSMLTGMGARVQPLAWVTTTAGADTGGPCYDLRDAVCKMLDGSVPNDELFGVIYTIDDGDDWTDFRVWRKANPNCGVSVEEDFLRARLSDAKGRASQQNILKCRHLNVWSTAREAYFNMQEWAACAEPGMQPEDFTVADGWRCVVAVDLAYKRDLAAAQRVFYRPMVDGKMEYRVFSAFYLPEATVQLPKNDRYRGWVNGGAITETEGNETDFSVIEDDIVEWQSAHGFDEMAYDPAHATYFRQRLQNRGVNAVEYRNTVLTISEPMKEMDAAIASGRLRHDGNPCMTWQVSCVTNKRDKKGNDFPNVDRPEEHKKDGPVATIMGIGRAMVGETPETSIYESGPL